MPGWGNFLLIAIGVGLIIYFTNKRKKKETAQKELEAKQKATELLEQEQQLEQLHRKWEERKQELESNGLPELNPDTLKLRANELCHFEGPANFCKLRKQTVSYEGGSRGVSVRVIKGVSVRLGNYQGHPIKEQVAEKTSGNIYLTSNKIIFTAITNSRVIKYKDIVNLNVIEDMLQIQTDDGSYLYQVDDSFNFMVILEILLNKNEE